MDIQEATETYKEKTARWAEDRETRRAEADKEYLEELQALKVGDGVCWSGYSDVYAGTIVAISKNGKVISVQEDNANLLNGTDSGEDDALHFEPGGFCGHTSGRQRYEYSPNPDAAVKKYSLRKNNRFIPVGVPMTCSMAKPLREGRHKHHDYNF